MVTASEEGCVEENAPHSSTDELLPKPKSDGSDESTELAGAAATPQGSSTGKSSLAGTA